MSFKVDLHSHSIYSPDGGLKLSHYKYFLDNNLLDYIAVTDHGDIAGALEIQKQLGDRIIVGEEIMTLEGEIVGLYLQEKIDNNLSATETVQRIKAQGGLVYIPHPFETVRSGISEATLGSIIADVDIIESVNGRAVLQNKSKLATEWAKNSGKAMAASSDAHGRFGWGYTYSQIHKKPTKENLVGLLGGAEYATKTVGAGILYPKLNRLKKKLRLTRV